MLPGMKTVIFLVFFLVGCPHPSSPDGGTFEAGANDCNLDAAALHDSLSCPKIEVHFSPNGGCQDAIVARIKASKKVRVQAYSFTAKPIIDALIALQADHGDVQVIIDATEAKMPVNPIAAFRAAKIPVYIDSKHALATSRVMVFDDVAVETGSYNYTNSSEHDNSDNCLILEDKPTVASYAENWMGHYAHATPAP